jgi:hypothetical protein
MKNIRRYIKCPWWWLISTLTIISSAPAQDSLAQYHPMSKGNIWIYRVTALPSLIWYQYREIERDSIISGNSYRIVSETNSIDSTAGISIERYDTSTGCYYTWSGSTDILEDSTFTFTPNTSFGGSYDCKVFTSLDTGLVLQTLTTTRQLGEGKLIKEDVMSWSYSYGLGLVFQTDIDLLSLFPIQTLHLVYAKIGGKEYGSVPASVSAKDKRTPTSFVLSQNYPNPFNPSTNISFSIPSRSFVTLKIYDMLGREVTTIVSEEMSAGSYSRQWNATDIPSGVYFYRLQAGNFNQTKKLILLK